MNFNFMSVLKHADKLPLLIDTIEIARDESLSLISKIDKISALWVKVTPFQWDDDVRNALMPHVVKFGEDYKTASTEDNIIAIMTIAGSFLYEIGLLFKDKNHEIYKWCSFAGAALNAIAPIADEFDIFVKAVE
jgi:hypothetical protein